jgi:hypothetical protein
MGVFTTHGGHQEQPTIDSESFSRSEDDIRSSYVRPGSISVCTRRSSVKFRFFAWRQLRYSQRCFFPTCAYIRDVDEEKCSVCEVYAERRTSKRKSPPTPQNRSSPFSGSPRCIAARHIIPRACCTTGRLTPRKKRARGTFIRSKRTSRFEHRSRPPFGAQNTRLADSLGAAHREGRGDEGRRCLAAAGGLSGPFHARFSRETAKMAPTAEPIGRHW